MNRNDLVSQMATKTGISKKQAEEILSSTLEGIIDAVKAGETVQLIGFGSFSPSEREAREGRNPRTGETINIPATTVVKFKPGKEFKEQLNAA